MAQRTLLTLLGWNLKRCVVEEVEDVAKTLLPDWKGLDHSLISTRPRSSSCLCILQLNRVYSDYWHVCIVTKVAGFVSIPNATRRYASRPIRAIPSNARRRRKLGDSVIAVKNNHTHSLSALAFIIRIAIYNRDARLDCHLDSCP